MKKAILTEPHFHDDEKAREYLEKIRWPNGPVCPHCGCFERIYQLKGQSTRAGLYKCGDCRKQFTVTVGTLFEKSKISLHKWLLAVYLMCASKKGMSSHQLHRTLGITYKTAWFMTHRIREAMKDPVFAKQLGGAGKVVEADETFWGNTRKEKKHSRVWGHKEKIFALVERGGCVRSFHVPNVTGKTLKTIMYNQIAQSTDIITDEYPSYFGLKKNFASHETVNHSKKEYVRGEIYTNTIENYFSILKRGLIGTFHHVGANYLKRYIGEFDFKYNNRLITDVERTKVALESIDGKRLLYRDSSRTLETGT